MKQASGQRQIPPMNRAEARARARGQSFVNVRNIFLKLEQWARKVDGRRFRSPSWSRGKLGEHLRRHRMGPVAPRLSAHAQARLDTTNESSPILKGTPQGRRYLAFSRTTPLRGGATDTGREDAVGEENGTNRGGNSARPFRRRTAIQREGDRRRGRRFSAAQGARLRAEVVRLFPPAQAAEASALVGRFESMEREERRTAAAQRAEESLGQAVRELSLSNQLARHTLDAWMNEFSWSGVFREGRSRWQSGAGCREVGAGMADR